MIENYLAVKFPEISAEWHPTKNDGYSPDRVTFGSNKKFWWQCSVCGHEWESTVTHRTHGRGCPICAKKRAAEKLSKKNLIPGETDLATRYPDIASEWHPTKNGLLTPGDVSPFSAKKVWWLCPKGHTYDMTIANRTSQQQDCPICSGQRILVGYNDLKSQRPDIAAEWDYSRNEKGPEEYTVHTNKKVYWLCEKGHYYKCAVSERTGDKKHSRGCPYCSGRRAWSGFNDLATVRPELAAEWDYEANGDLLPTQVTEFSYKRVHWKCKFGHKWDIQVSIRSTGNNCPVCANKKLLVGFNDLKTLFPDVAEEWDYEKNETRPEDHIAGTHKKVYWKCKECGHRWKTQIKERAYGQTGCPKCTFYHKTSFPEQAVFYYAQKLFPNAINSYKPDFLAPQEIDIYIPNLQLGIEYDGSGWHTNTERDFKKSQKLFDNKITLIRMREEGLPPAPTTDHVIECTLYQGDTDKLTQDLSSLFQKIADVCVLDLSADIDVTRDFFEIKAFYESNKKERSLLATDSEILLEWNYEKNGDLTPDKVTPRSHNVVWWKCSNCGKEWRQKIGAKFTSGLFCKSCSIKEANAKRMRERIQAGEAMSIADYPLLLDEWDDEANMPFTPYTVTYGSERTFSWICKVCGNHFPMTPKARTSQNQGCPKCGRIQSLYTRYSSTKKQIDAREAGIDQILFEDSSD